jgi:serine/threonine protein phosphatase PrpC
MEDYHTAMSTETHDGHPVGLFAVYDGHGGRRCVRYVRSKLFDAILSHTNFKQGDVKSAMTSGFMAVCSPQLARVCKCKDKGLTGMVHLNPGDEQSSWVT